MKKKKKPALKFGSHQPRVHPSRITLAAVPWDMGADGPANQAGLEVEQATDIDPETGKETPNPNGVIRRRRRWDGWPERYCVRGVITRDQLVIAIELRNAAAGRPTADPLAAIYIDRTSVSDPEADRIDARQKFHRMWAVVPEYARPVINRVVIEDQAIWRTGLLRRESHEDRLRRGLDDLRKAWEKN